MTTSMAFTSFSLNGVDAQKFLQGQVTLHVERLEENATRYTAICDLKGRIHFGLWLTKHSAESFSIVTTADQAEEFAKHIKKFGAFSKMKLEETGTTIPIEILKKLPTNPLKIIILIIKISHIINLITC